jgi:hypothetical protein
MFTGGAGIESSLERCPSDFGSASMNHRFLFLVCSVCVFAVFGSRSAIADEDEKPREPLPISVEGKWKLHLPPGEKVSYRGVASFDDAGLNGGQMLYPGDAGVAGFLIAIFAHAAAVSAAKDTQRAEVQEAADKVMIPFRDVLDLYTPRELVQAGLEELAPGTSAKLTDADLKAGEDWFIEAVPVYSMTQDMTTIILDNAVVIYAPGASEPAYQNVIRIVSTPKNADNLAVFWNDNKAQPLKKVSVRLYAESLAAALKDAASAPDESAPQRTVRYMQGDKEKIERANVLSEQCGRVVMRNLRGWIMSVPKSGAAPTDCTARL